MFCCGLVRVPSCIFRLQDLSMHKIAAVLADDIFKCIYLKENDRMPIQISPKFIPRSPIDNKPALI